MKKVVSIAVFGERHDVYAQYLPAFVRGALNLFPSAEDWRVRVHIDSHVFAGKWGRYLAHLFSEGLVDVAHMGSAPLCKAMLWRLSPVFDSDADFVFLRDLDAPPMPRDRACMDRFMSSGAVVHTIHDSNMHVDIMGGLCGFDAKRLRERMDWRTLDNVYEEAKLTEEQWSKHGADQDVLNRLLLVSGGPLFLEHRYNGWHAGPGKYTARKAGAYLCEALSSPVPDMSKPTTDFSYISKAAADLLGNHLGCAGYDYAAAMKFWDAHGNADVAMKIAKCEALV